MWVVSFLSGIIIVLILLVTIVFIYRKDKEMIFEIARSLGMKVRLSFFRGWIAESKRPLCKIFISSFEEATPDGNTLLIFITFGHPILFPLIISNHQSILSGFAFEKPGSRPRGLKRVASHPLVDKKLHIYCRVADNTRCQSFLNRSFAEMDRFTVFCNQIGAVFHMGSSQLKIGAESRSKPSDIKRLHDMAISILRSAGVI